MEIHIFGKIMEAKLKLNGARIVIEGATVDDLKGLQRILEEDVNITVQHTQTTLSDVQVMGGLQ